MSQVLRLYQIFESYDWNSIFRLTKKEFNDVQYNFNILWFYFYHFLVNK